MNARDLINLDEWLRARDWSLASVGFEWTFTDAPHGVERGVVRGELLLQVATVVTVQAERLAYPPPSLWTILAARGWVAPAGSEGEQAQGEHMRLAGGLSRVQRGYRLRSVKTPDWSDRVEPWCWPAAPSHELAGYAQDDELVGAPEPPPEPAPQARQDAPGEGRPSDDPQGWGGGASLARSLGVPAEAAALMDETEPAGGSVGQPTTATCAERYPGGWAGHKFPQRDPIPRKRLPGEYPPGTRFAFVCSQGCREAGSEACLNRDGHAFSSAEAVLPSSMPPLREGCLCYLQPVGPAPKATYPHPCGHKFDNTGGVDPIHQLGRDPEADAQLARDYRLPGAVPLAVRGEEWLPPTAEQIRRGRNPEAELGLMAATDDFARALRDSAVAAQRYADALRDHRRSRQDAPGQGPVDPTSEWPEDRVTDP